MGRKEVKTLLGEDTSLEKDEAFIPPPAHQEVDVKTKQEENTANAETVMTGESAVAASAVGGDVVYWISDCAN